MLKKKNSKKTAEPVIKPFAVGINGDKITLSLRVNELFHVTVKLSKDEADSLAKELLRTEPSSFSIFKYWSCV